MHLACPPEALIELTRLNPFDRFPDGRPRVPDDIVERMKLVTTEEAWGVLRQHGYHQQFLGDWFVTHPDRILVGRAVTTQFVPSRPDLSDLVAESGKEQGRIGGQNSWVIDILQTGDVMVVDIYGKADMGTFVGDNLATAVRARTMAGAVIEGTIRDYQGIVKLTDVNFFVRAVHPSFIQNATILSINLPIRIREVTIMPGDIVLGTPSGVIFIPPHLAQEVVEKSEDTRIRDEFGHQRLREGRYTPGEIDRVWSEEIEADFHGWRTRKEAPSP